VAAYEAFLVTIESSDKQAEVLSNTVASMEKAAKSVFASWEKDLDSFKSPELRRRSAARLEETRANYADILGVVKPVQTHTGSSTPPSTITRSSSGTTSIARRSGSPAGHGEPRLACEELETALDHCNDAHERIRRVEGAPRSAREACRAAGPQGRRLIQPRPSWVRAGRC
jgi:hypothetical protein